MTGIQAGGATKMLSERSLLILCTGTEDFYLKVLVTGFHVPLGFGSLA